MKKDRQENVIFLSIDKLTVQIKEKINSPFIKTPRCLTIICFCVAFTVGLIVYINPLHTGDNILYALSSISQGLAAIFTLMFAITIFCTQMINRYTSIDKIFDDKTICLMLIFSIGIILPLIQLVVNHNYIPFDKIENLSLAFDVFLASFCVLSIIPYSMKINTIVKYDGGTSNLAESASEAIDFGRETVASNNVSELIELGKMAVQYRYWDKAHRIIEKLKFLGVKAIDKEWRDLGYFTIGGIKEICLDRWYEDIDCILIAMNGLREIGLKSIEKKLDGVTLYLGTPSNSRNYIPKSFADINKTYNNFDYNSACSKLGISNVEYGSCRVHKYINLLKFSKPFEKVTIFAESEKDQPNLDLCSGTGAYKTNQSESALKRLEFYGIERFYSFPQLIMGKLAEIGIKSSYKSKCDKEVCVTLSAMYELFILGINAINNDLSDGTVSMSIYCIYTIGVSNVIKSNDTRKEEVLSHTVKYLKNIANEAYNTDKNKFKNSFECSLGCLWILGACSNRYLPEYAKKMASELEKSDDPVIKENFGTEDICKGVKEYLDTYSIGDQKFIQDLNNFKDLYNKSDKELYNTP